MPKIYFWILRFCDFVIMNQKARAINTLMMITPSQISRVITILLPLSL